MQHADALYVSTPATQAEPLRRCLNKNLLLLRAATVIWYCIGVIRFKKVPKVFLCQLRRHISHPQRSAGASENNQSISTVKKKKKKHGTFRGKRMRSIPPTQVAQGTDRDPQLQDKEDLFKKHTHTHTHTAAASHYTHITAVTMLIENADASLSKWRMCDLTPANIRISCQNCGHSWIFLQQQQTLPFFKIQLLIKEQTHIRGRFQ